MYRFLLTPRWIGLGLLMVLASAVMVGLGFWQLDRYEDRSEINARIDAADQVEPRHLTEVLSPPRDGVVGPAPTAEQTWSRVTVTGRFDPAHEMLARARSMNGSVGFEVITPLVLPDGTAVLVDRGWLPSSAEGASVAPQVPAPATGDVTVVGRVHAPESRGTVPEPFDGRPAVRRIDPQKIAEFVPYPIYGAYLTLESQTPPADPAFVTIPPDHENATLNAGYTVQWWAFAVLTLVGYGYLAYRNAHPAEQAATEPASREPSASRAPAIDAQPPGTAG